MATGSFRTTTLPNICAAISLVPIATAIYGITDPAGGMKTGFELSVPGAATPESSKLAFTLMRLYAWRSMGLGVVSLAVWYSGDRRALGLSMLAGTVLAFGDGVECARHHGDDGVRIAMKHWFFIPVGAGIGAALLGWV